MLGCRLLQSKFSLGIRVYKRHLNSRRETNPDCRVSQYFSSNLSLVEFAVEKDAISEWHASCSASLTLTIVTSKPAMGLLAKNTSEISVYI